MEKEAALVLRSEMKCRQLFLRTKSESAAYNILKTMNTGFGYARTVRQYFKEPDHS